MNNYKDLLCHTTRNSFFTLRSRDAWIREGISKDHTTMLFVKFLSSLSLSLSLSIYIYISLLCFCIEHVIQSSALVKI